MTINSPPVQTQALHQRREAFREVTSVIPSIAVGAAATCFALGLLIVNIYLNRYGVYAVELLRSDFVLVGAVFVFLVAVATFGAEHGKTIARQIPDAWREKKRRTRVRRTITLVFQALFAFVLTPVVALTILSRNTFMLHEWELWVSAFLLGGTGGHAANLFRRAIWIFRSALETPDEPSRTSELMSQAHFAVDVVLSLSMSIGAYALITYPHLAPAYGGGHRDLVLLVPTAEGVAIAKHLGLPFDIANNIGPLKLLSDNSLELAVVAGDADSYQAKAIRIGRQYVNAIVVLPSGALKAAPVVKESKTDDIPSAKRGDTLQVPGQRIKG